MAITWTLESMIGQTYGLWTVLRQAESDKSGRKRFICRCACGKERRVSADNLRRGKSTSCGHTGADKTRDDLTGRKYGRLTALRSVGRRGNNLIWLCRCECGNECEVAANNLKNGHTTSCGCRQSEILHDIDARMLAKAASPLTGKFETNHKAKYFCLEHNGRTWHIRNLRHFVREHAELFGVDSIIDYDVTMLPEVYMTPHHVAGRGMDGKFLTTIRLNASKREQHLSVLLFF